MAQLLRHGFIAALAPVGSPAIDILVTDEGGAGICGLQLKTRRVGGADGGWHMGVKHERVPEGRFFYAFVEFAADPAAPTACFVVPAGIVADALSRSHREWLDTPGRGGKPRRDGAMRRFLPDYTRVGQVFGCGPGWLDPYREAWHQLPLPAPEADGR
ncbi:hypothetical protein ACQQ2N_05355 [Dokdonella sp. MW10]|uniref:hypothetical protein n=1 Tax=Dokdonella sp. MW10 TaxID=2992926 RepID=UPI003F7E0396